MDYNRRESLQNISVRFLMSEYSAYIFMALNVYCMRISFCLAYIPLKMKGGL